MALPRPSVLLTQAVVNNSTEINANRKVVHSSVTETVSIRRTQIDVADLSLPSVSTGFLLDNVNVDKTSDLAEGGELLSHLILLKH